MIGTTVSHYTILKKLGGGGMGVVYQARDTRLNRIVALKFLPPHLTQDEESKKRFIQEAQAASSLQHPAICTIHDVDETTDGQLFIVMDCYEGETLKHVLQRGSVPIEDVENFARQMAQGLLKAHESGIIHRDLKPENIMITSGGFVKIIDFGLAKLMGAVSITRTGSTPGTISYMSPEQIQGGAFDHRTDIWSFGVLLYEMLTGVQPFTSEFQQATMYRIITDSYVPVSSLRPDAPQPLVDLVDRCLKKNETERLGSMAEALGVLGSGTGRAPFLYGIQTKTNRTRRVLTMLPLLVVGVLLAWYFLSPIFAPPSSTLTIAILRFQNQTNDEKTMAWPFKVQEYLSEGLTGLKDVAVKHYTYMNDVVQSSFGVVDFPRGQKLTTILREEHVDYYLDGTLLREPQKYSLHAFLVDARNSQQLQSFESQCEGEADLVTAVGNLADQIVGYLSSEILKSEDDLKIWKQRRPKNWKAVGEFNEASEFFLTGQPGWQKLERAIELDSSFISPRVWIIPSLIGAKKYAEAKEHYEYLLRLKPQANNFESAMIDWVGAFLASDYDRQAYYLRVALISSKDNRILLDNLAYAEQSLGHYSAAVEAMQPCLRSKWRYAPMYRIVGECLLKMQDIKRAKSILNDALANAWVDIRVAPMLTAVYKKEGEEATAERFQQTTLKAYKESTGAYGLGYERIAGYLVDVGLVDSAAVAIQKALDENPRVATHHYQYADILLHQGRLPEAEQQCYQTMLLDSTLSQTHFLLGQVFDKKGDRSDAVRQYNQFLTFDSTSYEAQITRQALSRIQR